MDNKRVRFTLLLLVTFALVGAVLALVFSRFLTFSELRGLPTAAPEYPIRAAGAVVYNPPSPQDAPESIKDAVLLGYQIMMETRKYAGAYVGNKLQCVSCHFKGGITEGGKSGGLSLVGVGAVYPLFRTRQNYAADLITRTNSCFERSMNGKPLPPDSKEMAAILTYYQWISKGLPVYGDIPWRGLTHLKSPHVPDPTQGSRVFGQKCAMCHGASGEGNPIAPPLWGPQSFNDGAGMSHPPTCAAFSYLNMPWGNPDLTEDQALDVGAFVATRPRPHFARH